MFYMNNRFKDKQNILNTVIQIEDYNENTNMAIEIDKKRRDYTTI